MVVQTSRFKRWVTKITYSAFLPSYDRIVVVLSFLLAGLLAFTEFFFSQQTQSLLLFGTGLAQLSLSVFILILLYDHCVQKSAPQLQLAATLLHSFFLLLFTGSLFLEIYARTIFPADIAASQTLVIVLISLFGNVVIQRLLLSSNILKGKAAGFRLRASEVNAFFIFALFSAAMIHLTSIAVLDSIIALVMGLTLSTWAGVTMIDAYWKILEEKNH